jgi:hypothetical protein
MAVPFTQEEREYVGLPPRPLIPEQRIINGDGTPTFEFNLFLTTQYEWQRRLLSVLTEVKYPAPRPESTP